jgi:hypothetical protein
VRPYLDQLGLDVAPDTPMAALSIAQQQLVEIAKALSLDARLLIMDEPTSSLTLAETAGCTRSSRRCASGAWRSSTSRTGSAKCGRRRPRGRAARRRERRRARREELTHDNMIG